MGAYKVPSTVVAVFVATLLLVGVAATQGEKADWPCWRGPDRTGISPEKGINKDWNNRKPKVLWSVDLGGDDDWSFAAPVIAGGKVFIVDHKDDKEDVVRAFDLAKGQELWEFVYPHYTNKNREEIERWGCSNATPAFDEGRLYVVTVVGDIYCLDAGSGKKIWSRNFIKDFSTFKHRNKQGTIHHFRGYGDPGRWPVYGMHISPIVDSGRVIVCPGGEDAAVVALDKKTGKAIWKGGGSDKPGLATPVVATIGGQRQYVVLTAYRVCGVDAATGKLLWSIPWKLKENHNIATPVVDGNSLYILSSYVYPRFVRADITDNRPEIVWDIKPPGRSNQSPFLHDGRLYLFYGKQPRCVDPKDGKIVWQYYCGRKKPSSPALSIGGALCVDGTFIVMDHFTGDVVMLKADPSGYKELGRIARPFRKHPSPGTNVKSKWYPKIYAQFAFLTPPAVADGKLIVRGPGGMACIDLK